MKIAVLGASGRTGRLLVEQALAEGHTVRALVRHPEKFGVRHERMELITGDATQAAAVATAVAGCDAVVSALGPVDTKSTVCSTAAEHVIAAGVRRYVALSGAGIDMPGDEKDFVARTISLVVRTLTPAIFRDKVREADLLQASTIPWVLVRPPRLVDRPGSGQPKMSFKQAPGASIARADVAAFLLRCVSDTTLTRKAPFIAG